jgi:hypothetical protein
VSAHRAPLVVAPGALPLAAGLAAYPLLDERTAVAPVVMLGAVAFALFVAAVGGLWPGGLAWAVGLLAVEYLAALELRGARLDVAAPAYAGALFLCAELGWLGLEARAGGRPWLGRAFAIGVLALAGSGLGLLLLLAATVSLAGGPLLTGVGVAAACGVAVCLAWLARR